MVTSYYTITHKCGHEAERKFTGVVRNDLETKALYWQKCLCPTCSAVKQEQQATSSDLPALTGSEKQVAWAIKLRQQIIARTDAYIADFIKWHGSALQAQMRADRARMIGRTEAKFWIENREGLKSLENA